jgi:hypothetical protein
MQSAIKKQKIILCKHCMPTRAKSRRFEENASAPAALEPDRLNRPHFDAKTASSTLHWKSKLG